MVSSVFRMVKRKIPFFCFNLIFVILFIPFSLSAQEASQAQRQHEQRLKDEQDRLQERLRRDNPTQDVFLQPAKPDNQSDIPADEDAPCINVSLITVQGVTVIAEEAINQIIKSYMSRCLSLKDINQLIANISNLYLDKGYITSRAFVQPQKIEKGTLDVLVVEGKIEKIQPTHSMKQRELNAVFPIEELEILNLRDLEQGMEQLNRLQQNSAQLDIKPGSDTGLSVVNIINEQTRPFYAQVFVDNSGSEPTGQYMLGTSVTWDNPIHLSDSLYLTFSEATHGAPGGSSTSYAVQYSIPQGYFLWTLNANRFNYEQLISGASIDFVTSGESDNQSLGLDYTAFRSQRSKWNIRSDITKKVSNNYIEDVFLDTSSRTLYLTSLGVNSTYKFNTALLRGGITWTQSFSADGATKKLSSAETDFQFNKYTLDLGIYGGFELFKHQINYSSALDYFYSPTSIVASEALSLGSQYTVRGFDQESVTGYKGGYWRNEISLPKRFMQQVRVEPYIAYDIGKSDAPDYNQNKATLSGVTFGLRSGFRNFSVNASYSAAATVPEFLTKKQSVFLFDARSGF